MVYCVACRGLNILDKDNSETNPSRNGQLTNRECYQKKEKTKKEGQQTCAPTSVAVSEVLTEVAVAGDESLHVAAVSGDDGQGAPEPVTSCPLLPRQVNVAHSSYAVQLGAAGQFL